MTGQAAHTADALPKGRLTEGVLKRLQSLAAYPKGEETFRPPLVPWQKYADREVPPSILDGWLSAESVSALIGDSNGGKTLFITHLMLCMVNRMPFLGLHVEHGEAVYLGGEGMSHFPLRLRAWREMYKQSGGTLNIWRGVTNLLDTRQSARIALYLGRYHPDLKLFVIDTLSLNLGDGDENDNGDMAKLVRNANLICEATGAHVMLSHHCTKDGKHYRGASALRGNLDTMLYCEDTGANDIHRVWGDKQRDGSKGELFFRREVVAVEPRHTNAETINLEAHTSVVAVEVSAEAGLSAKETSRKVRSLTPKRKKALQRLAAFGDEGATFSKWKAVCTTGENKLMAASTFADAVNELEELGYVAQADDGHYIAVTA